MGVVRASVLAAALGCVLFALPAAASTTSAVNRVAVAGAGVTSAFPKGVTIELHAPPGYVNAGASAHSGTWLGPEYWASGNHSLRGRTEIKWSVRFVHGQSSSHRAAWLGLDKGWPYLRKDPIAVPHMLGTHVLGTILGFTVLTKANAPSDASYEGSLALPVGPRAYALVSFVLDQPPSDSAGDAGSYLVQGEVSPSAWEVGQAFWSFSGARLIGKLPPRKVLVGVNGHRMDGTVQDYFQTPVPRATISLQRRSGAGWATVATATASRAGHFKLLARRKGAYRVRASAAGVTALSRTVSVSK